ncbi:MAG: N-acetyltransferase [Gammaproteobacteria bacterium]|nr:MAG: N-acetyltransferase [Gammaproteobacteria bacterium]
MRVAVINRLNGVPVDQWNRVSGISHPFLRHEFLAALECHSCVGEQYGWYPQHLAVYDDTGTLAGLAPLYLKDNSYGEFVFDWSWADAYQRSGKPYYPKLVSAIPYTPVTGPRLLVRDDMDYEDVAGLLIRASLELVERTGASSLHWLFTNDNDTEQLLVHKFLRRTGCHFHWHNRNYRTFADFLGSLSSRKRKKVKRERRFVEEAGIRMEVIHGSEASEAQWQAMHHFYTSTFERKSGMPTLSLEFFLDISQSMGDQIVLVMAYLGDRLVAGAINLCSDKAFYGRHWGCLEKYHSLHFETCYYQGIEYSIKHGLGLFEPGVQGEHKISRGFLPTLTWSAHWIADTAFRGAIARYLDDEHRLIMDYSRDMQQYSPYRMETPG